ncbi:Gfo/Idh/MocA family oxidoreductase [Actinotalea sp. K2]|uniref:Gfo/Idh/MocA family protein n=1 Tax=Actinotalea sp. K2 TaxID=2939438 RepID=UPI002017731C|nr:Gfo/Idh/MocA family oxidoreductase [Actinotalea sp. K2]MCL3861047.1 Gfo/Idh/MocA family oxidoreductase [Actinotalea sp. K2]
MTSGEGPVRVGVVGTGWRAGFFLRVADLLPDRFTTVGVVSRTASRGQEVSARWGAPSYRTVSALLAAQRPELVVVAVPWEVAPEVTVELAEAGVPVLTETPPAPDVPAMVRLWGRVGASGLVQVAEHSPFLPAHAARAGIVGSGLIGRVTSVQVSSTHRHHAAGLVRHLLGAGLEPVTVTARRFVAPLVDPTSRAGLTLDPAPRPATTTLALLDLGEGRSAVYDFTDNQWRNPLRGDRILVRGSHGEIRDGRVTRWVEGVGPVDSTIVRRQNGVEQDLEGFDLDHLSLDGRVVHRNPYAGARLSDDDQAVATLLDRTGAWTRGHGEPPYPLAQGCQDHLIGLAVEEAATTGHAVTTTQQVWAR